MSHNDLAKTVHESVTRLNLQEELRRVVGLRPQDWVSVCVVPCYPGQVLCCVVMLDISELPYEAGKRRQTNNFLVQIHELHPDSAETDRRIQAKFDKAAAGLRDCSPYQAETMQQAFKIEGAIDGA